MKDATMADVKYKTFKDLERNILTAKMNVKVAKAELAKFIKLAGPKNVVAMDYDKAINTGAVRITDEQQIADIIIAQRKVEIYSEYLLVLEIEREEYLRGIERIRKTCNSLELEVFYRHHIKRQSLNEISQTLDYDYGYIRKINMRVIEKTRNKKGTYN